MTFPEVLVLERSADEGVDENAKLEKMDADAGVGTEATPKDEAAQVETMPQGQGWWLIDLLRDAFICLLMIGLLIDYLIIINLIDYFDWLIDYLLIHLRIGLCQLMD